MYIYTIIFIKKNTSQTDCCVVVCGGGEPDGLVRGGDGEADDDGELRLFLPFSPPDVPSVLLAVVAEDE